MTIYRGRQVVQRGFYFDMRRWTLEMMEGESGTLPGDEGTRYLKMPLLVLFVAAPLMGLLFVIAIPFVGLAVIGEQVYRKVLAAAGMKRPRTVESVTTPRR